MPGENSIVVGESTFLSPRTIIRTTDEIDRVMDWVSEGEDRGTHFNGESYENGIRAMYEWLVGITNTAPDEE